AEGKSNKFLELSSEPFQSYPKETIDDLRSFRRSASETERLVENVGEEFFNFRRLESAAKEKKSYDFFRRRRHEFSCSSGFLVEARETEKDS
ncbi:hypothetical protein RUM43_009943, partial [Polyplax serrata]